MWGAVHRPENFQPRASDALLEFGHGYKDRMVLEAVSDVEWEVGCCCVKQPEDWKV
jgi:hypothetical protein